MNHRLSSPLSGRGWMIVLALALLPGQQIQKLPVRPRVFLLLPDLVVTAIRFAPEQPTTADRVLIEVDMPQGTTPARCPGSESCARGLSRVRLR